MQYATRLKLTIDDYFFVGFHVQGTPRISSHFLMNVLLQSHKHIMAKRRGFCASPWKSRARKLDKPGTSAKHGGEDMLFMVCLFFSFYVFVCLLASLSLSARMLGLPPFPWTDLCARDSCVSCLGQTWGTHWICDPPRFFLF